MIGFGAVREVRSIRIVHAREHLAVLGQSGPPNHIRRERPQPMPRGNDVRKSSSVPACLGERRKAARRWLPEIGVTAERSELGARDSRETECPVLRVRENEARATK